MAPTAWTQAAHSLRGMQVNSQDHWQNRHHSGGFGMAATTAGSTGKETGICYRDPADHLVKRHLAQGLHGIQRQLQPLVLAIALTLAQTVLKRMVSSSSCPSQANLGDAMSGPPKGSRGLRR